MLEYKGYTIYSMKRRSGYRIEYGHAGSSSRLCGDNCKVQADGIMATKRKIDALVSAHRLTKKFFSMPLRRTT